MGNSTANVIAAARRSATALTQRVVDGWKATPGLCPYCGHPVDVDALDEGERVGWCRHCRNVFREPLLKVPGWIIGTILLLLIKTQAGW